MIFYVLSGMPDVMSNYRNCVILIKDNWDDWFKFETKHYMYYIDAIGEKHQIGSLKIGQVAQEQRSAQIPTYFSELPNDCFSLGQSDYFYEELNNLGEEIRKQILTSLHDIAFDLNLYKRIKGEDVTRISLMRDVTDFTIKQQFHRIAQGSARLTSYDIEYTYPTNHTDNPAKLTFSVRPESNPPTNIQVIIGRNSVGKTFLIKNIIRSIYIADDDKQYGILRSTNGLTGRLVNARTQAFANILCVSFSPFDNYEDIIEITSKKRRTMPFSYIGLSGEKISQALSDNFVKSLEICQKSERKIQLLKSAMETLETDPIFAESNFKSLLVLQADSTNDYENKKIRDAASQLFVRLSSGHQVIILTLVQLVDRITEKSLVILDEPENHLHPPLLSAFIRALSELLMDRNAVAIIATHSPVILQEVPKSCVWKINRSGYEVSPSRLEIESFGATIGSLTSEVFGLEVRHSGFHKMLIDEVNKGNDYNSILDTFQNELGDEAKALLQTLLILREKENETFE